MTGDELCCIQLYFDHTVSKVAKTDLFDILKFKFMVRRRYTAIASKFSRFFNAGRREQ